MKKQIGLELSLIRIATRQFQPEPNPRVLRWAIGARMVTRLGGFLQWTHKITVWFLNGLIQNLPNVLIKEVFKRERERGEKNIQLTTKQEIWTQAIKNIQLALCKQGTIFGYPNNQSQTHSTCNGTNKTNSSIHLPWD